MQFNGGTQKKFIYNSNWQSIESLLCIQLQNIVFNYEIGIGIQFNVNHK